MQTNFDPTEQAPLCSLSISSTSQARIISWSVAPGDKVRRGVPIVTYSLVEATPSLHGDNDKAKQGNTLQLKSTIVGVVRETLYKTGDILPPGLPVVTIEKRCDHSVVVYDLCTDCGLNLRKNKSVTGPRVRPGAPTADRISMVHGVPEIQISRKEAVVLANKDKLRLLQNRKLALIIDLDQTLIHTSVDPNIEPGLPDVYGFNLPGHPMVYHCRLRPHARQFLESVSKYYETHVFTMGTKLYAASVTHILDPDKKLFYGRIISRDDCFDPHSKALRLKSVFPCGDAMVAIIDDREDVWGRCPNLIHVKPYVFFAGTTDINAPPGSQSTSSRPHTKTSAPPGSQSTSSRPHTKTNAPPGSQSTASHPHTKTNAPPDSPPSQASHTHAVSTASPESQSTSSCPHIGTPLPYQPSPEADNPRNKEDIQTELKDGLTTNDALKNHKLNSDDHVQTPADNQQMIVTQPMTVDDPSTECVNNTLAKEEGAKQDGDKKESSSSSSSSDTEDSSSSSSSEIDDTLFDNLERENIPSIPAETTNKTNQDKRLEQADRAPPTQSETQINKCIPDEKMDVDETNVPSSAHHPGLTSDTAANKKTQTIRDPDDFLLHLTVILKQAHKIFYLEYDEMRKETEDLSTPDLKQIIPKLRQSVLKGTKILFTGVVPTNVPPEKVPEWNTARAFGASIHDRIVHGLTSTNPRKVMQATTHVIAGKPGTSKLREAKRIPGMKIVSPKWLWSCAEQWKLVDERLYPVQFENKEHDNYNPPHKIPRLDTKSEKSTGTTTNNKHCATLEVKDNLTQDDVFTEETSKLIEGCSSIVSRDNDCTNPNMAKSLRRLTRHLSSESHLSVSDEELEKMNAEVDAEISGSTSSEEEIEEMAEFGSVVEEMDDDDSFSYDTFAGTSQKNRKRKHEDVSSSSENTPLSVDPLNDSLGLSDEGDISEDESGDELAALLGVT